MKNIDVHAHIIPGELIKSDFLRTESEQIAEGVYSYAIWGNHIRPAYAGLTDEKVHLAYMEEACVHWEILSIPPYLFGYHKDVGFCKEWARAYNEAL
ncbi:MAG: hypothetical protein LBL51_02375, partial [Synergistaceae bacterium]|nr:hypothetical protein [Synergistaceae bacterium]